MKTRTTAREIFNTLLDKDKILTLKGQIRFYLGDVHIVVHQKDVVGNIIQEWLQGWLEQRGFYYRPNPNTQMPPDFFLSPSDKERLLEVKSFNCEATPAFDIADFRAYEEELIAKPWMLYADYLIFAYHMNDDGIVTIKDLWLKKVWQITRRMDDWPLNLQVKSKVVHKIRPGIWYTPPKKFRLFNSVEHFVSAVEQTVWQNPKTKEESGTWLKRFNAAHKAHFGQVLKIPRWNDIEDNYIVPKKR